MFSFADGNLVDAFLRWVPRNADAPAIIDRDEVTSYRALEAGMLGAASCFADVGWRAGSVVGVVLSEAPAALHLAVILGLARLGVIAAPLEPGELGSGAALAMLRRHRAVGLVTDMQVAPGPALQVVSPRRAWLRDRDPSHMPPPAAAGGAMPWLLQRTSGTSGEPKEFLQSHANCLWRHSSTPDSHRLNPGDRAMSLIDLSFYVGLRLALRCLFDGATLVAKPRDARPEDLPAIATRDAVKSILATPAHMPLLLCGDADDGPRFPDLKELLIGTSHVAPHVVRACQRHVSRQLYNIYGSNEVGAIAVAPPCQLQLHPHTVGSALPGVQLEVVDPEGRVVPAGSLGEVRVRTPGMIAGYLDNPQADARHFRDGWFYPGDAGMMNADGLLFLNGRTDDLMNYRGVLIGPPEIEIVAQEYLGLTEVVAFGVPHESQGDVPVLALGANVMADDRILLDHCRAKLGRKAPVAVIRVKDLPRNLMGKTLRRALSAETRRMIRQP